MANIIDYVIRRGEATFKEKPFNELDAAVLCQVAYWDLDEIVPEGFKDGITMRDLCCRALPGLIPSYCSESDIKLRDLLKTSRRFSECKVFGYVNKVDEDAGMQFCAMTFCLPGKVCTLPQRTCAQCGKPNNLPEHTITLPGRTFFVAFRGTDSSLVGWKENMDLAYNDEVPSQREAVEYVKQVAKKCRGSYIISGHSKGGNLAVYSSAFSNWLVRLSIKDIYNFDGPGFNDRVIQKENFIKIKDKIHTFVPQNSMVGMLLEHKEEYQVIQSTASNGFGQHVMYTWETDGDMFVYRDKLDEFGEDSSETMRNWINDMTYEEKRKFVEVVYGLVDEYGTMDNLLSGKNLFKIIGAYIALDDENKKAVSVAVESLKNSVFDKISSKIQNVYKKTDN